MMKKITIVLSVLIIAMLTLTACKTETPTGKVPVDTKNKVQIDFYVMSQCPYGLQVENGIKPVLDKFGEVMDFNLEFIGAEQDGKFLSLHGENEVNGNKVQLCAQKYNKDKFMEMVVCMNKDAENIPDNWEGCAEGLDIEKIKTCYEGSEGDELLKASFEKAAKANAQGSPTMFFENKLYLGGRDEESFTRAVCRETEHELCTGVPECKEDLECPATDGKIPSCENPGEQNAKCVEKEDPEVEAIIISSSECTDCDVSGIITQLKNVMPNLVSRDVDISSEEGKKIIEENGIEKVPIIFFAKEIKETFLWKNQGDQLMQLFDEKENYLMLKTEATKAHFLVDETKRKELLEKRGITKGDNKPQIDFFVMSYCPYGNIAEEGIAPVYDLLKDKADFKPHYVIYSNYGGEQYCYDKEQKYCSMHGVVELNQGVRELCVANHIGMKEYFDFVLAMNKKCDYKNADECWEAVAKELSLDVAKIKKCYDEEAEDILKEELELNKAFGAQGSPQVFIDGNAYNDARAPENYKKALCDAFETAPSECETGLSTTGSEASGSCS